MKGILFFYLSSLFSSSIIGYYFKSFINFNDFEKIVNLKGPWDLNIGLSLIFSFFTFIIFSKFWDFKSLKTRSLLQTLIDILIISINSIVFSLFFTSEYKYFISIMFSFLLYFFIFPNLYIYRRWCINYFKREEKSNEQNFLLLIVLIPYILIIIDTFFLLKSVLQNIIK